MSFNDVIIAKEGENNEKLLLHPRNTKSLTAYRFVHNSTFYALDLLASLTLLSLAVIEPPAVVDFKVHADVIQPASLNV